MEFKENLIWIRLDIFQDDCPISLLSLELDSEIEIINTFINYYNKKVVYIDLFNFNKNNLLKFFNENNYFIKKYKPEIKLIKSTSIKKSLEIIINDTEMGKIYNDYLIKCLRIYPVKVKNGEETWNIICENQRTAKYLIEKIEKLKHTKINFYKIYNLSNEIKNIEYIYKTQILNDLLFKINEMTSHEKNIILYAFKNGFYNNKIDLEDIARHFNTSKSYISKTIRKNEKEILKIILNFISNFNEDF